MAVGAFLLHRTLQGTSDAVALSILSIALAVVWCLGALALLLWARPAPRRGPTWDERLGERLGARRHPVGFAVAVGAAFAIVSLIGALVLLALPFLGGGVSLATGRVDDGPLLVFLVALVTGAAEELFFRVGLLRLLPARSALVTSTALYGLVTLATGNLPLVLAAVLLGAVCAVTLRATGRWYTPLIVHALWTVALVGILPLV